MNNNSNRIVNEINLNTQKYNTLLEFAQFLRQNGDKLFEKDAKLCLRTDQLLILQDYLEKIIPSKESDDLKATKKNNVFNSQEFLSLYKSNQLHIIQDFLFKITNLKITAETPCQNSMLKLKIFGSITYLEIKNCPIVNVNDLQTLRNQLEVLICIRSLTKIQELLHLCGADQSMPLNWPKLHTLNLSHNQLNTLDNSFRLTTSIQILDLSHNNIKDCSNCLHNLKQLKKVNLSFNKLEKIPSISDGIDSLIEYLDISYNNIEKLDVDRIKLLANINYLNLNSNLINDLKELKNLMFLNNISYISLEQNPVKNDLYCDLVIAEIKTHRNAKRTNLITKNKKTPSQPTKSTIKQPVSTVRSSIQSFPEEPRSSGMSAKMEPFSKRKLKANNVLIEQDENTEDEYLIVNVNQLDPSKSSLNNKLSMSYSEYESNNLQIEIENMKLMRQNYGTDWLLSTPNLINNKTNLVKLDLNYENDKQYTQEEENTEISQTSMKEFLNLENATDPFVVYKYELTGQESNERDNPVGSKDCVFLSLNDKYIIEKDETNSSLLNLNEFSELTEIKLAVDEIHQIKFMFKTNQTRVYEFENSEELNIFVGQMHKILFNHINIIKCELFYCIWCMQFTKKSKFSIDDTPDSNQSYDNLTCTICSRYLVKEKIVQEKPKTPEIATTESTSLTLKDVLKTFKTTESSINEEDIINNNNNNNNSEDTISISTHNTTVTSILSEEETNNLGEKINNLLSNNKVTKAKLDEISNESKRININLKLYLIINVLNQNKIANGQEEEEEDEPVCLFKLKYLFYEWSDESRVIENCVCILTKTSIVLFRVINLDLFNENSEFDKCLKKEMIIEINKIETIEVGLANNYLIIETSENHSSKTLKFFTMDVYQTSTFRNILLKIMNESNNSMILKNSRKNNHNTKSNLAKLLTQIELSQSESADLDINIFTFIDELAINDQVVKLNLYGIHEIFLYSHEYILLLEENLNYFQSSERQFSVVELARISDVVQLRLFKEEETKLEISFVDESRNSKQITWQINFRKQPHMLSQLIALLKNSWEKIYAIELPINY